MILFVGIFVHVFHFMNFFIAVPDGNVTTTSTVSVPTTTPSEDSQMTSVITGTHITVPVLHLT